MLKIRRTLICAAAIAVTALALPAAAGAAARYASPDGVGADPCTSGAPCPIDLAVEGASGADEVILVGGVPPAAPFVAPPNLNVPNDVVVRGATGVRPVVTFAAEGTGFFLGSGSVLRDLDVEYTWDSAAIQFNDGASPGVIERVFAHTIEGDEPQMARAPCFALGPAVIRDSVCWYDTVSVQSAAIEGRALFGQVRTVTVRNSTAISSQAEEAILGLADGAGSEVTLNVTNSIVQAATGPDAQATATNEGTATVALDHSNYDLPGEFEFNSGQASVTDPITGANQMAPPVFVDAPAGDFRQAASSTGTLNLGTATGLLPGELDLDGNVRSQGTAPDIGAYESTPPIVNDPPSTPTPPTTKKKCKKKKKKKGKKGAGAAKKKKCKKKKKK